MSASHRSQHGAALLLLLLMLSMGAATLLINGFGESTDARRRRETLAALAQAREALMGYALVHGRLPRPAQSAVNGTESAQSCASATDCTGFIPWVTLNISGLDSWARLLRYSVTPAFTEAPLRQNVAVADKRVLGRRPSGATYFLAGQQACEVQRQCVPAVVFSSGRHNPGVSATGLAQVSETTSNIDEIYNDSAVNDFIQRPATPPGAEPAPGGEFDDLLLWLPLTALYQRMGVSGVLD